MEYTIEIKKPLDGEYLAKLCDAIHAKIDVLTESHDIFKASSEESDRAVGSVRSEGQGVIGTGLVGAVVESRADRRIGMLHCANCVDFMADMEADSVDMTLTSHAL